MSWSTREVCTSHVLLLCFSCASPAPRSPQGVRLTAVCRASYFLDQTAVCHASTYFVSSRIASHFLPPVAGAGTGPRCEAATGRDAGDDHFSQEDQFREVHRSILLLAGAHAVPCATHLIPSHPRWHIYPCHPPYATPSHPITYLPPHSAPSHPAQPHMHNLFPAYPIPPHLTSHPIAHLSICRRSPMIHPPLTRSVM